MEKNKYIKKLAEFDDNTILHVAIVDRYIRDLVQYGYGADIRVKRNTNSISILYGEEGRACSIARMYDFVMDSNEANQKEYRARMAALFVDYAKDYCEFKSQFEQNSEETK